METQYAKHICTNSYIHLLCPFQLSHDNVQKYLSLKLCDIVTMVAKVSTNPLMEQKGLNLSVLKSMVVKCIHCIY